MISGPATVSIIRVSANLNWIKYTMDPPIGGLYLKKMYMRSVRILLPLKYKLSKLWIPHPPLGCLRNIRTLPTDNNSTKFKRSITALLKTEIHLYIYQKREVLFSPFLPFLSSSPGYYRACELTGGRCRLQWLERVIIPYWIHNLMGVSVAEVIKQRAPPC